MGSNGIALEDKDAQETWLIINDNFLKAQGKSSVREAQEV